MTCIELLPCPGDKASMYETLPCNHCCGTGIEPPKSTRAASPSEWQPIESAPKDKEVFIGRWYDGKWEFHKSVLFFEHGNEMAGENYSGWFWSEDDGYTQDPEYWCEMPPPPNNHNLERD